MDDFWFMNCPERASRAAIRQAVHKLFSHIIVFGCEHIEDAFRPQVETPEDGLDSVMRKLKLAHQTAPPAYTPRKWARRDPKYAYRLPVEEQNSAYSNVIQGYQTEEDPFEIQNRIKRLEFESQSKADGCHCTESGQLPKNEVRPFRQKSNLRLHVSENLIAHNELITALLLDLQPGLSAFWQKITLSMVKTYL